jgi:adenine/guanine/hypoxanthine permease
MGLLNLLASLQCIESAAAAGDSYSPRSSLMVNGARHVRGGVLRLPVPDLALHRAPRVEAHGGPRGIFDGQRDIRHPRLPDGAMSPIAWAVPADAGLAIIIWIGFIITVQAFEATDQRHWPAVVMGMVPVILAWITFSMKSAARFAGAGSAAGPTFGPGLLAAFHGGGSAIEGGFAIEQGTFLCALIFSTITVLVIDRRLATAALWALAASALSALGFLHSWRYVRTDTVGSMPLVDRLTGAAAAGTPLFPAAPYAVAYACLAAVLLLAKLFTVPDRGRAG